MRFSMRKAVAASSTGFLLALCVYSLMGISDQNDRSTDGFRLEVTPVAHTAEIENRRFLGSEECALCHSHSDVATAMRDKQNRSVAPYDLWQSSMMANSARDPYWRAAVSAEIDANPQQQAVIEEVCTRCHAPMVTPVPASPAGESLAFLAHKNDQTKLALDGVSCTVCHQISADLLGEPASFTGKFQINSDGKIYGPHANPVTMPMQRHVGYTPTQSPHILKSALCATCHTVITESVDSSGALTHHSFHEQSPYLEWRNSVFNDEVATPNAQARSCQSCHMPTTDDDGQRISTKLAHNPGGRDFPFLAPRSPFGRHTLVGANAFMTRILRDNAKQLGVVAPRDAMDASIKQIDKLLSQNTAKVEIGEIDIQDDQLTIPVAIHNLCGHKLPTAYPSRRVWIRLIVRDASGKAVFSSGEFNAFGELVDQHGQVLPSETAGGSEQPHVDVISQSDQVQVYETIMADLDGNATYTLLNGATYRKDNRLLPQGWKSEHDNAVATQPFGVSDDTNFVGGSDQIRFVVATHGPGSYTIEASAHYQTLSPRHANELFQHDTAEVRVFKTLYDKAQRSPELLGTTMKSIDVQP
jgi:hypothetical protein